MKKIVKFILLISPILIIAGYSCSNMPDNEVKCNCIMDTLKGEWRWTKKSGGFLVDITDSEFKSIIKILSQNEDESINYEVFVEDTLFYKGSFQIQKRIEDRIDANIKLPHEEWLSGNWCIFLCFINENTLCFWDGVDDGYNYIYEKIK